MSAKLQTWQPCPHCGDPEPGMVWMRVDLDHELPAECPECHGSAVVEVPLEPIHEPMFNFNDPSIHNPFTNATPLLPEEVMS